MRSALREATLAGVAAVGLLLGANPADAQTILGGGGTSLSLGIGPGYGSGSPGSAGFVDPGLGYSRFVYGGDLASGYGVDTGYGYGRSPGYGYGGYGFAPPVSTPGRPKFVPQDRVQTPYSDQGPSDGRSFRTRGVYSPFPPVDRPWGTGEVGGWMVPGSP